MATRLTAATRKATIEAILREHFAPQFVALADKLTAHGKALVAAEHPEFIKARKNTALRPYIAARTGFFLYFTSASGERVAFRKPARWGGDVRTSQFDARWVSCKDEGLVELKAQTDHPEIGMTATTLPADSQLVIDYLQLWANFSEAQATIRDTIAAYSSREKFEADFAQLSGFLPPRTVAQKFAVTVPVADVTAKLAGLGIPAK